ncbi:MAG: GDP-L-fucose synthase [Treponemataceae bacterium]|nr:MAG: GDP-L-fucose synthase [Treponemataceae bacterium]
MKILITGSHGMVGHNILDNAEIQQYDVLNPASSELDLLNYGDIENYLRRNRPDMIIHCAGKVGGIQANMTDMYGFFTNNAIMGINLVKSAKEQGIKKLLNLSSSCTYPRNYKNPLKEEYVLQGELEPTNEGYAMAKLAVQKMCEYISRENPDFQYKTLIPCNLYGRWDKFSEQDSHMIPSVIKKIHEAVKADVQEISIWGDGCVRREFMYTGDLVSCITRAVHNFDTLPCIMNVGLGFDFTINEYYETVKRVLGYKGTFTHDMTKPVGMSQKLLDITRQTEWGWEASTTLEEGIRKTYDFFIMETSK